MSRMGEDYLSDIHHYGAAAGGGVGVTSDADIPHPTQPFLLLFAGKIWGRGVELRREGGHNETRFRRLNAADIFLFSERANELLPPSLSPSLPSSRAHSPN